MMSKAILIAFIAVAGVKSAINLFGVPITVTTDERNGR